MADISDNIVIVEDVNAVNIEETNPVATVSPGAVVNYAGAGGAHPDGDHTDFVLKTGGDPDGKMTGELIVETAGGRTAYFSNTAAVGTEHTVTYYNKATSGVGSVAMNAVSDNEDDSAAWIRGHEKDRGTVKITHEQPGVSDANAAAVSIDLRGATTAARGIFIDAEVGSTGDPIAVRNGGAYDIFAVRDSGDPIIHNADPQLEFYDEGGTSGSRRWRLQAAPARLDIIRLNDSGGYQGTVAISIGSDDRVTLVGDPTTDNHAATKKYVDDNVVTGGLSASADETITGEWNFTNGLLAGMPGSPPVNQVVNIWYVANNYSALGHTHTGTTISGLDAGDTTTGTFAIARIPMGSTGSTAAYGNHDHSGVYELVGHDHTGVYAPVHSHPYSSDTHDHSGVYEPVHSHPYASDTHDHDADYLETSTAGGTTPGKIFVGATDPVASAVAGDIWIETA